MRRTLPAISNILTHFHTKAHTLISSNPKTIITNDSEDALRLSYTNCTHKRFDTPCSM